METGTQECKLHDCTLASVLPVGIFHTDVEGHYLWVNEYWCEIAGITAVESEGNAWVQVLYPDDKERVFANWYRTVQENLPFRLEYRVQRLDGKITWVLGQAVAKKDKTGTVIGYVGTLTDITEYKQIEEKLSKDRYYLKELVQERSTELQQVNEQLQQEIAQRQRVEETQARLIAVLEATTSSVGAELGEISARVSADQNITKVKQAEEELALRNRELLTLHRISEIHLSTESLKATLQEIVEEISTATGFPIIAIEFYDEVRQMMVFEAIKGIPLPPNSSVLEVPADQTFSGTVARTGQPFIKIYAPQESKACDSNETLKQLGIKTFICMPMMVNGCALGTLSLAHPEVIQLDEHLPQWIASLANYVASLTERKRTETKLLQANERFELAAKAVNSTIYDWDIVKNSVQRTKEVASLLGYGSQEAEHTMDWWLDRIHPDDRQQIQPLVSAALAHEEMFAFEYRICNNNNQYLHIWDHGLIIRDADKRAVRVVGSMMDITRRKQVEEILRQQFLREQLITRISRRIHQSLNLEEILNTTVTEVRQFLESDRVIIYRLESNKSGVVVVESVGSGWRTISGTIINDCYFAENYFQLYQQGRIQALEDIYTADLTPCHVDLLARFQVRANLVVPIVQEEQLWGLLVAQQCSGARKWQPLEIDLLQSLATQAAIAIQKSELYAHSQAEIAQRQQAEAALHQQFLKERLIAQSAQRIRQSLNLEDILNTTVAEVQQFLHVDRVLIYRLWSNGTGSAVAEAVVPGWSAVLGRTFPEEVFPQESRELYGKGRILTISDVEQAIGLPCLAEFVQQFGVKAKLVVPILQEETLWGLLIVHQCSSPHHWQPLEIDLMKSLATQLAIAIQQSQLYQQSRAATATALTQAQQIEEALSELQRTQSQLVQSEKMSSLGQLVAGVAHEINNPVTFIYANLIHAKNYTQDILGLLNLYQQQYPHPTPEISLEIEALDLDFLIKDLPKLLSSMKVGAERICEIVAALRNFSRLAEAEMKEVDIHEGLDSTLTLLQNRLKAQGKHPEIQVIKEYGNLPKIECYAGQLNQVFMNLLSNAIDAIDEQNQMRTVEKITANPSIIRIHTEIINEYQVAIRIVDNGPGITEQVKARIFDPFFTTKPVGAGTGLGLSISYQIIVEKHGGQLECESVLGQGTEFVIQLPLWQRAIAVA